MQDRHDSTRTESVMLCPTYQTSWVMENLHDKSGILPDPDIFAVDNHCSCFISVLVKQGWQSATALEGSNFSPSSSSSSLLPSPFSPALPWSPRPPSRLPGGLLLPCCDPCGLLPPSSLALAEPPTRLWIVILVSGRALWKLVARPIFFQTCQT